MEITPQTRKQLRRLQQDPAWPAFELFAQKYMEANFIHASFKRDNEFETIWQGAYSEGGKGHLQRFMNELEQEAMNADE